MQQKSLSQEFELTKYDYTDGNGSVVYSKHFMTKDGEQFSFWKVNGSEQKGKAKLIDMKDVRTWVLYNFDILDRNTDVYLVDNEADASCLQHFLNSNSNKRKGASYMFTRSRME